MRRIELAICVLILTASLASPVMAARHKTLLFPTMLTMHFVDAAGKTHGVTQQINLETGHGSITTYDEPSVIDVIVSRHPELAAMKVKDASCNAGGKTSSPQDDSKPSIMMMPPLQGSVAKPVPSLDKVAAQRMIAT